MFVLLVDNVPRPEKEPKEVPLLVCDTFKAFFVVNSFEIILKESDPVLSVDVRVSAPPLVVENVSAKLACIAPVSLPVKTAVEVKDPEPVPPPDTCAIPKLNPPEPSVLSMWFAAVPSAVGKVNETLEPSAESCAFNST